MLYHVLKHTHTPSHTHTECSVCLQIIWLSRSALPEKMYYLIELGEMREMESQELFLFLRHCNTEGR